MVNNQRFVAHIDILGFRMMVRNDAELAWHVLSDLANIREHLSRLHLSFIETAEQQMLSDSVFSVMFSDTILLYTQGDTKRDLEAILIASGEVLHKAMFNNVPVRIGVAHGLFFVNSKESMYAGPALIEAYDIGEAAQWLGIVVSETIWQRSVKEGCKSGQSDVVIAADIPTKLGLRPGYAMNWPATYRHDLKVLPPIPVELFYSQFEHALGPFCNLNAHERAKYVNTTDFLNLCLERV